jgi:cytochrome bd-type quinol oxidase subunit 2
MDLNYQIGLLSTERHMQKGRSTVRHPESVSKLTLLAIITVSMIAILWIPVIMPHITHPSMIYHISMHIISVIIALFLSVVSILAYRRNNNSLRLLFMSLGFCLLAGIEFLYLFHATVNIPDIIIPIVDVELSHAILLIMLTLFGIGVLKVNRSE